MSSTPTLVVRCDLGPSYGVGHLMRCIALAEEFAGRGFRPVFSADAASVPFALEQLASRGFDWVAPPATDAGLLDQMASLGATAVVIDSYHLPPATYAAARATHPTLTMVDGDPAGKDGHVLLDQNIGAEDDIWSLPQGARRLAGLNYSLMRDDVLAARARLTAHDPPASTGVLPRVFAFFGGTDAFAAAPAVTRALLMTTRPVDLHVVGATPELRAELAMVPTSPGQRVTVLGPTSRLAEHVVAADVVLSAAGSSSWELLCLGAACAFVCVAANQRESYDRVVGLGVVAGLGHLAGLRADPTAAMGSLARLLDDSGLRDRLSSSGGHLVDGRGRERVADALIETIGPAMLGR